MIKESPLRRSKTIDQLLVFDAKMSCCRHETQPNQIFALQINFRDPQIVRFLLIIL